MWPYTESAGGATEVEISLHPLGEGVRLDLRHEGWGDGPEWEEALGGHFAGWLQGLAALGLLLETGCDARVQNRALKGRERYFISGEIPADSTAVYRALTDAAVLARWSGGVFDGAVPLETIENRFIRWTAPGGAELTAILRPTPRGTHVAIAEYGVADHGASQRWPGMFERLARFLG